MNSVKKNTFIRTWGAIQKAKRTGRKSEQTVLINKTNERILSKVKERIDNFTKKTPKNKQKNPHLEQFGGEKSDGYD